MKFSIGPRNRRVSNMTPAQKLLMAAVFVLLGLGSIGYGYTSYNSQGDAISEAVSVNATVTQTEIEVHTNRRSTDYEPLINFEYTYDGQDYQSDNRYPAGVSDDFNTRSAAESFADRYSQGTEVVAYLDPDSPGQAFLLKERSNQPLIFIGIGAFMILAAVYLLFHRFFLG